MPIMSPERRLRAMVSASDFPELSDDEIHMLLETNSIASIYQTWAPNTAYAAGDLVVPSPRTGLVYEATQSGTSDISQPPFDETTDSLTDGTVVWELAEETETSFNLRRAAAEGWRLKAGKVANRFDMKTEINQTTRSQMYKHCMEMYKSYKQSAAGSVLVQTESAYAFDPAIVNLNPAP